MSDVARRVGIAGAAAIVGVKPVTWRGYVHRGQAPKPDGREEISGSPWWWESTVKAFARSRVGQGYRSDLHNA